MHPHMARPEADGQSRQGYTVDCFDLSVFESERYVPGLVQPALSVIMVTLERFFFFGVALMKLHASGGDGVFFFRKREPGQEGLILGVLYHNQPTYHLLKWSDEGKIFTINGKALAECTTLLQVSHVCLVGVTFLTPAHLSRRRECS